MRGWSADGWLREVAVMGLNNDIAITDLSLIVDLANTQQRHQRSLNARLRVQ